LVVAALAVVGLGAPHHRSSPSPRLPASPPSALHPANVPLGARPSAYWAPVLAPVSVRRRPTQATAFTRLSTRTPEGTANIALVLGEAAQSEGTLWIRVRVPGIPDDITGWVPRSALGGYTAVTTRLVVYRRSLTATLLRDGERVFRARVGIGTPSSPTPGGRFYVRNELVRYRSPFYGPIAFGTSARTTALTDWPAGGFVGIHGTDRPDLLPGRVSHGCIRMTNRDILQLARLMPVGTLLTIR
jgi:L,D-transpeptidase catalytic domain